MLSGSYPNPGFESVPNNTVWANTSGGTASPTARPFDFNIFDILGADKTGVSDSTAALNAATILFPALDIPAGTYSVCGFVIAAGDVERLFRGPALLKTAANCNLPTMRINCSGGLAPVRVEDLWFDGNGINQSHTGATPDHGLYFVDCPSAQTHHIRVQNAAGHSLFYSNPGSPGQEYAAQTIDDVQILNGGVGNSTYGSGLDVSGGVRTKISNVNVDTVAKVCFRLLGTGLHLTNVTGRGCGEGGIVPVSGSSSDITIDGGKFQDGTIFSDTTTTGTTNGTTALTGLSHNVLTAGWNLSFNVSGTNIPAGTTITAIAADGLSATMSAAATGSGSGIALTVTNANDQDTNDGVRLIGVPNTVVNSLVITGMPGNGISFINGSTHDVASNNVIYDNGKSAVTPGSTAGRSGIKIFNTTTANTNIVLSGNNIFDDQGLPTQLYDTEVNNSSDFVIAKGNVFGTAKTGPVNLSTSGTNNNFSDGNTGYTGPSLLGATTTTTLGNSGQQINSASGAASTPAYLLTGSAFTGGSGTSTQPLILLQPTGTSNATNWSTSGTEFGVNAVSGFVGDLFNLEVAGSSVFRVSSTGAVRATNVANASSNSNSQVALAAAGTQVTRNVADANPALIATQQNASSTGDIIDAANNGGTVFGIDQKGRIVATGAAATVGGTGCAAGTPTPDAVHGQISTTAATSCTVTFATTYTTAPACTANSSNSAIPVGVSATATVLTLTTAALTGSITYHCIK